MGLSASQLRLLALTGRKSDLELQGQQINQRRLQLAYQMEQISDDYTRKISNRNLFVDVTGDNDWEQATVEALNELGYTVLSSEDGLEIDDTISAELLERGLREGTLQIAGDIDWRTSTSFKDSYDETDDVQAEALYESAVTKVETKDKRLELELQNIDTQHSAVQTEIEAVNKVIDKNIEMSFKTFA